MAFALGCSSLALPLFGPGARPAEEILDAAFAAGPYDVLELHLSESLGTPEGGRVIPRSIVQQIEAIARGAMGRGAKVLLGLGGRFLLGPTKHEPSLIHPDPEGRGLRRRLIEEAISLSADLGMERLVFLSGPSPLAAAADKHSSPEWHWLEEGMERLLVQAEARGVVLSPEAHSLHLLADVADVQRLHARFPSPFLGFTADTVHQTLTEARPLDVVYRELSPRISHVQLDNTSTPRAERGRPIRHTPVDGEGEVDLVGALAGLYEGGYRGTVSVEFLRVDFPDVDALAYCLRVGQWLRDRLLPLADMEEARKQAQRRGEAA
ncbi:MAG TPA: sugar phosphate isomerase/epimerase [Archangium sp.]|jgi:sugar phosphate isomerase/epimerase|uniref:sugar phosphate isomerase/epimerase family protein n=1 Tax=Archangium sp. TaxID=1872627 RepID=UPI002EDA0300